MYMISNNFIKHYYAKWLSSSILSKKILSEIWGICNEIISISKYNKTNEGILKCWDKDFLLWCNEELWCLLWLENKFIEIINYFKNKDFNNWEDFLWDFFDKIKLLKWKKFYNRTIIKYEEFKEVSLEQQFYRLFHNWWINSLWWDCNHASIFFKNIFDKIWINSEIVDFNPMQKNNHSEVLVKILNEYFLINIFSVDWKNLFRKVQKWEHLTSWTSILFNKILKEKSTHILFYENMSEFKPEENWKFEISCNTEWGIIKFNSALHNYEVWKIYFNIDSYTFVLDMNELEKHIELLSDINWLEESFKQIITYWKYEIYKNLILKIDKEFYKKYLEKILIWFNDYKKSSI